jgi:hypothetical protein
MEETGLYPRLLGAAWAELDETVRLFHGGSAPLEAHGRFAVHGDSGLPVRLARRLLRLPAPGTDVPVRLTVTPHAQGERWHRRFGQRVLQTEQAERPGGLLAERVGPLVLLFRLQADEAGALVFQQIGAALRLGPARLPLPRRLAPQVDARVQGDGPERLRVSVQTSAPLLGRLLAYEGTVEKAAPS